MFKKNADRHRAETASRQRTYEVKRLDAECGSGVARMTPEALDRAIVAALQAGPMKKWQLRDQLHEPETVIARHLKALRLAGVVKMLGMRDRLAWALTAWQDPIAPRPSYVKSFVKPEAVPSRSWWVVPAEEFGAVAKQEAKRMEEEPSR